MRHGVAQKKLNRTAAHREAIGSQDESQFLAGLRGGQRDLGVQGEVGE